MKRLFWEDPYMKEFEAVVTAIQGNQIQLNQTAFYPESGGQIGDTGTIESLQVTDTKYTSEKDEIIHFVAGEISNIEVGSKVHCRIDWDRRYRIMRNHTALHILFLLFEKAYGSHEIIGSQVRDDKARVDFSYFGAMDVAELTDMFSEVLPADIPVRITPDANDPEYRRWEIDGYPEVPCGGTHVRSTGEINAIKLKRKKLGSQGVRIYCTAS